MRDVLDPSAGSLRAGALAVAVAAVCILFQSPAAPGTPPIANIAAETAPPGGRVWSVRTDGWVLRMDGAEVSVPTVDEQIADAPKLVLRSVKLSPFDHVIQRHAAAARIDWRLVAAVIFEESRFKPDSRSPKGAFGLMQVREIAADAVGEYRFKLPEDNVRTGVRYLQHLDRLFPDLPERQRQRFVLAAYNAGPGHVADARELATRLGYDPNRWEGGIRETLPLLEEARYHETVAQGYAQGRAVVRYVERVLERNRYYQRMTAAVALEELAAFESPIAPD